MLSLSRDSKQTLAAYLSSNSGFERVQRLVSHQKGAGRSAAMKEKWHTGAQFQGPAPVINRYT